MATSKWRSRGTWAHGTTSTSTDSGDTDDPSDTSDTTPACDDSGASEIALLLGNILGADVGESVCNGAEPLPAGNETQHSDGVKTAIAQDEVDLILRGVITGVDLPGDVPCGSGSGYDVLCTSQTLAFDGPVAIFYAQVAGEIDLAEATHSYQFGFVFDTDGDPANDYVPGPSYPADFFAGTDRWFYSVHNAGEGWYTWASSGDVAFQNVPSSERIVIAGDKVMLIVDEDEVTPQTASWRLTAFRHLGDYGQSMPWSGDVVPPVSEGLSPVQ